MLRLIPCRFTTLHDQKVDPQNDPKMIEIHPRSKKWSPKWSKNDWNPPCWGWYLADSPLFMIKKLITKMTQKWLKSTLLGLIPSRFITFMIKKWSPKWSNNSSLFSKSVPRWLRIATSLEMISNDRSPWFSYSLILSWILSLCPSLPHPFLIFSLISFATDPLSSTAPFHLLK